MHFPIIFVASALFLNSLISSAFAVPPGRKRDIQYCTSDDILGPLSDYLPFQADVTKFCSTLIGIQNVATTVMTTTPTSIVYSTTMITGTTARTITSYTTTATVTTTTAVFELERRNEVDLAARSVVTDALESVYNGVHARQATAGTKTNFDASAISAGLVSACSCLYISPATDYITATASTQTRSEGVIARDVVTDTVTTIASGATTVTVLFNSTSYVLPVSSSSIQSSIISTSTLSSYSLSNSLTSLYPSVSLTSSSLSSTAASLSSSISSSAPFSSTVGPVPTGCPYINGTFLQSTDPCHSYQYICGVGYPDEDFYDLEESYDSLEMCAADVCTHANSGQTTPCLGVVWSAANGNCRELKSLVNPFHDQSSIGALSVPADPRSCPKNISSSSMVSPTSAPYPVNVSTSSPTSIMSISMNGSAILSMNNSATASYPTSTGSQPHHRHNHTQSWNGTWPTYNHTWSVWMTTGYTSSGTAFSSGSPIPTSNNTCPTTTALSTLTKFATLYSETYTLTETLTKSRTVYANPVPENASTITQVSVITIFVTDFFTATIDATTTVVNTHHAVVDTTSTSVETDLALSTTTETSLATVTETDTTTATTTTAAVETDSQTITTTTTVSTETDLLTVTTIDSTETTTTTSYASTESKVATLTTTDSSTTIITTIISTDLATSTTTVGGNPVAGRSGRSWWMF